MQLTSLLIPDAVKTLGEPVSGAALEAADAHGKATFEAAFFQASVADAHPVLSGTAEVSDAEDEAETAEAGDILEPCDPGDGVHADEECAHDVAETDSPRDDPEPRRGHEAENDVAVKQVPVETGAGIPVVKEPAGVHDAGERTETEPPTSERALLGDDDAITLPKRLDRKATDHPIRYEHATEPTGRSGATEEGSLVSASRGENVAAKSVGKLIGETVSLGHGAAEAPLPVEETAYAGAPVSESIQPILMSGSYRPENTYHAGAPVDMRALVRKSQENTLHSPLPRDLEGDVGLDHAASVGLPSRADAQAMMPATTESVAHTIASSPAVPPSPVSLVTPAETDLMVDPGGHAGDVADAQILRSSATAGTALQATTDAIVARPEAVRHAAAQAVEILAKEPGKTVEIALNPEELGRVRLSLSTSDAGMTVSIVSERPETLDLMRRHIDQLSQEFQRLGYQQTSFEFSGEASNGDESAPGKELVDHDGAHVTDEMQTATPTRLVQTGLDLRL
ncbi:flagellar hook-length control protein FliK [Sedimentitalea sp. XS_ASV28]|uniref:flagellar hook-length control protein FliK n=1 Tax=Sedimentitalea sp. XS_ASV28 TaxID=3241296 RepID=UPI00351569E4